MWMANKMGGGGGGGNAAHCRNSSKSNKNQIRENGGKIDYKRHLSCSFCA